MSAWTCRSTDGKAADKIVPPRLRIPYWKGLSAESEEKREPANDIDTGVVDSLKVLDPDGRLEKQTWRHVAFRTSRSESDMGQRLPCERQREVLV